MAITDKYELTEAGSVIVGKKKANRGEIIKAIWAWADEYDLKPETGGIDLDAELKEALKTKKRNVKAKEVMKLAGNLFA